MATIERLIDTKNLKTARLKTAIEHNQANYLFYDDGSDALLWMVVPPTTETVVHYIDEHMALLYEPDSLEVVGFQVEAFQHSFVEKHSSLELKSVRDSILAFERKKKDVAHELADIFFGQQSLPRQPVPA